MSDRVLDKYFRLRTDRPAAATSAAAGVAGSGAAADEGDLTDDLGAFGWLRGVRERAVMLELRRRDGSVTAFALAWLARADFDPSNGITLEFGNKIVKVAGRNLDAEVRPNIRLFSGLVRHRVPWIREADRATALAAPQEVTLIENIEIG